MDKLIVTPIICEETIKELRLLADEAWQDHYKSIFKTSKAIARSLHISKSTVYYDTKNPEIFYYFIDNERRERIGYFEARKDNIFVFIKTIYIIPEHRGKRYGRRILRLIEKFSRSKGMIGAYSVWPNIDQSAIKFLKENGYRLLRREPEGEGKNRIINHWFAKELIPQKDFLAYFEEKEND